MGRPKHLLRRDGLTWLELTVRKLMSRVDDGGDFRYGAIAGHPCRRAGCTRCPRPAGTACRTACRFPRRPGVSWLVCACDLPHLDLGALDWLLSCRKPGVRAVLPDLLSNGQVEPLLAYYDCRCRELLEELAGSGSLKLSDLVGKPGSYYAAASGGPAGILAQCQHADGDDRELIMVVRFRINAYI